MVFSLIVTGLVSGLAALLALPTLSDLLATVSGGRRPEPATPGELPRFLVLVPAHDEEKLIGACVESLLAADYSDDLLTVCVIADNCRDGTATAAVAAGARCLVRNDRKRRGKPHALAWALSRHDLAEYDSVIIIDADTVIDPGFYHHVARVPDLRTVAVQAQYATQNVHDNDLTWLSSLFADARYYFAFPLKDRAGLNSPLMGNGMCIGADVLSSRGWTAFSITENWELYAQYTLWGVPIRVAPEAILYAEEARTLAQSRTQRERWAAGKLGVLMKYGARIGRSAQVSALQKLDAVGELLAPGPVTHVGIVSVLQLALVPVWSTPAMVLSALLWLGVARHAVYSILAARRNGSTGRFARALFSLPRYLVWRVGVQLGALKLVRSDVWVRTQRN